MTEVYLCDNEPTWIEQMEQAVLDFMIGSDWALTVACRAAAPEAVLDQLTKNNTSGGIYFLDIALGADMTGLTLAQEIRKYDPRGFIIFVTTHSEILSFRSSIHSRQILSVL